MLLALLHSLSFDVKMPISVLLDCPYPIEVQDCYFYKNCFDFSGKFICYKNREVLSTYFLSYELQAKN